MAVLKSYVRVAPDSTGKKIANLQFVTVNADGSEDVVQVQQVSITDEEGRPYDLDDAEWKMAILDELKAIRFLMLSLVEGDNDPDTDDNK